MGTNGVRPLRAGCSLGAPETPVAGSTGPTYAAWTTRVLLSTTAPEKVTVLRSQELEPLTDAEMASIPRNAQLSIEDAARLSHEDLRIGHLLAATEINPDIYRQLASHFPAQAIDPDLLRRVAESLPTPKADLSRIEELLGSRMSIEQNETLRLAGLELLKQLRERGVDQPDDE